MSITQVELGFLLTLSVRNPADTISVLLVLSLGRRPVLVWKDLVVDFFCRWFPVKPTPLSNGPAWEGGKLLFSWRRNLSLPEDNLFGVRSEL